MQNIQNKIRATKRKSRWILLSGLLRSCNNYGCNCFPFPFMDIYNYIYIYIEDIFMPRCYRVNKLTIPTTLINLLLWPFINYFSFYDFLFPIT